MEDGGWRMEDRRSRIGDRGSGIGQNSNKVKEKIILGQFKHSEVQFNSL